MKTTKNKKPDKSKEVSQTRHALLELIDNTTYESQAMCYTCLRMASQDNKMGSFLLDVLKEKLETFSKNQEGLDVKSDILPTAKWLSFFNGFTLGATI